MNHRYDYGQEKKTPGDYVIRFGMHKGKRLRDIRDLTVLDHYLRWDQLRADARDAIVKWLAIPVNRRDLELQLEEKGRELSDE